MHRETGRIFKAHIVTKSKKSMSSGQEQKKAWLNTIVKVFNAGLSFLLYILMARAMTPEAFADVILILTWLAVTTVFCCLSMPITIVRFVTENLTLGRYSHAAGVLKFAFISVFACTCAVSCGFTFIIMTGMLPINKAMSESGLIGCGLLIPNVIILILNGYLQSQKRVVSAEIIGNSFRSFLMIAGIGILWMTINNATTPLVMLVYLIVSCIIFVINFTYSISVWPKKMHISKAEYEYRIWFRFSFGFMGVMLATIINERVDIIIMGMIAPASEIAQYGVATRISQTLTMATGAVASVMAPHFVEYLPELRNGRIQEIGFLLKNTARTMLYICLIALAGFLLLAPKFLLLFGHLYTDAYSPLIILIAGQTAAALFGPAIVAATLLDELKPAVTCLTAAIVINIILNILLVPRFGANGAGIATASAAALASGLAWIWIKKRYQLDTSVMSIRLKKHNFGEEDAEP